MSIAKVTYQEHARIKAEFCSTQEVIYTDADADEGGLGYHPCPVDILAESLAACALTTIGLKAEELGESFIGSYAEVEKIEYDMKKWCVSEIRIAFHLQASIPEEKRKRLEAFAQRACFVGNTLTARKDFVYVYE